MIPPTDKIWVRKRFYYLADLFANGRTNIKTIYIGRVVYGGLGEHVEFFNKGTNIIFPFPYLDLRKIRTGK